jgi:3-oxoacyl-[acyl-carrier-protein] synthase II
MLALQVFGGSAHCNVAIEFGLRGVGTTNSNSCASGNVAIGEALRYIREDWADVMIAGAAEAPLSPLTYGAFDFICTMSRSHPSIACRPFDQGRDGFVMGEGAASLVLEEYEHATTRGAEVYAEVIGYSLNNDAFHMTTPLPTGDSCTRAICDALNFAQVNAEQIDYINAHASSTQLNDANEALCIQKIFNGQAKQVPVSGTKPYYGHPLGASAAIEGVLCALAIRDGLIPPTLNYQSLDPACDLDVVPNEPREKKLTYVLSNAFGFGGINSSKGIASGCLPGVLAKTNFASGSMNFRMSHAEPTQSISGFGRVTHVLPLKSSTRSRLLWASAFFLEESNPTASLKSI